MNNFASEEYIDCKKWIAEKIQQKFSWEQVKRLCVKKEQVDAEFDRLQNEELIIPQNMTINDWIELVTEHEKNCPTITEMYGLSADGNSNTLLVPTDSGSPWVRYKNHLLGKYDGKPKMSDSAVTAVESNCHWILNHIDRDTRKIGAKKGLVMGSVQSGKTANMIGLVSMAAHYDWNFFIILSGTIDNLRKQTRDRFSSDLMKSGGVSWHILDYTSKPEYLKDINDGNLYSPEALSLNVYQDGKSSRKWMHRYVSVCLKNSTRLCRLIDWLHSDAGRAARLRILVIDDEADQASVNTRKMDTSETDEDLLERTAVNQLIINLVNGKNSDGSASETQFQAMNYISFTATPYANVLNEAYESSLYPKDFICSLPESNEYFGPKVVFGSTDDTYPGMNIVRTIPADEMKELKPLHNGETFTIPAELKKTVYWFLCSAAILRISGYKKPISMLVHTTSLQSGHFEEYEVLKNWLFRERKQSSFFAECETIYNAEKIAFTLKDLQESYPDYGRIDEVNDEFPEFDKIKDEIKLILSLVENIMLGEDGKLQYFSEGLHLCVDNCRANKMADEGTYLRVVYPSYEQLSRLDKAPVFIVMGGNTLSRGLTIEGLICTYFARNTNQADSLMQMGRWFGYRKGVELLQRIWMPSVIQDKYAELEKIDEKLKEEFKDFMIKGISPSKFGPKILNSSVVAKFMITSKNKSQNAEYCDFDFSGNSYETTKFNNSDELSKNLKVTNDFLTDLCVPQKSEINDSSYIWRSIDSTNIVGKFLDCYHIFDSSFSVDIAIFIDWLKAMNNERKYLKWNVAVSGDKNAIKRWNISGINVGTIERSRKIKPDYIDIGSLRSGRDALCDVELNSLSKEQRDLFDDTVHNGQGIISARGCIGYADIPLLLLYKINKDGGKASKTRNIINSDEDIIGFSIIVPGDAKGTSYATAIHVKINE